MSVGQQANNATIDGTLTNLALQLSALMGKIRNLNTLVNNGVGGQTGTQFLESIGYDAADAATAEQLVGYLNNLQGVYYGTATVAAAFDFDNQLSVLWGGQVQ